MALVATLGKFKKDPQAVLDWTVDWGPWLTKMGDSISEVAATVTPTGALKVDSVSFARSQVTVWLSGGVAGSPYQVTVHVTTAGGRQDDRSFVIDCKDM
ncbi:phage fiber-tail adaptor protein [Mycobacteroides abscessus]